LLLLRLSLRRQDLKFSGCDIDEQFITDEPLGKPEFKPMVGFDECILTKATI